MIAAACELRAAGAIPRTPEIGLWEAQSAAAQILLSEQNFQLWKYGSRVAAILKLILRYFTNDLYHPCVGCDKPPSTWHTRDEVAGAPLSR